MKLYYLSYINIFLFYYFIFNMETIIAFGYGKKDKNNNFLFFGDDEHSEMGTLIIDAPEYIKKECNYNPLVWFDDYWIEWKGEKSRKGCVGYIENPKIEDYRLTGKIIIKYIVKDWKYNENQDFKLYIVNYD